MPMALESPRPRAVNPKQAVSHRSAFGDLGFSMNSKLPRHSRHYLASISKHTSSGQPASNEVLSKARGLVDDKPLTVRMVCLLNELHP